MDKSIEKTKASRRCFGCDALNLGSWTDNCDSNWNGGFRGSRDRCVGRFLRDLNRERLRRYVTDSLMTSAAPAPEDDRDDGQ